MICILLLHIIKQYIPFGQKKYMNMIQLIRGINMCSE